MAQRITRQGGLIFPQPAQNGDGKADKASDFQPIAHSVAHSHIARLPAMPGELAAKKAQSGQSHLARSRITDVAGFRRLTRRPVLDTRGNTAQRVVLGSHELRTHRSSSERIRNAASRGPDLILLATSHPLYRALARYRNASEHHLTVVDTRVISVRDAQSGTERVANWPVDEAGNTLSARDLAARIKADARFSGRPSVIMSCPLDHEYLQSLAQHLGVEVRNPPKMLWVHKRTGQVGTGDWPPARDWLRLTPRPSLRVFTPQENWIAPELDISPRVIAQQGDRPPIGQRSDWKHLGSEQFPEQRQWYKKTDRDISILVGSLSPTDVNTAYPTRILSEIRPGMTVLDIGCGFGQFVRDLRERGIEAKGIDPQEDLPDAPYLFNVGLQDADFAKGAFDAILSAHSIFNYSESSEFRLAALRKMADLLKPGGKIYLGAVTGSRQLASLAESGEVDSLKVVTFIPENRKRDGVWVTGYVEFVKIDSSESTKAASATAHSARDSVEGISVDMARALLNGVIEQLSTARNDCLRCIRYADTLQGAISAGDRVPVEAYSISPYILKDVEENIVTNVAFFEEALKGLGKEKASNSKILRMKRLGTEAGEARTVFSEASVFYKSSLEGEAEEQIGRTVIDMLSSLKDKLNSIQTALDDTCRYGKSVSSAE